MNFIIRRKGRNSKKNRKRKMRVLEKVKDSSGGSGFEKRTRSKCGTSS